MTGLLSENITVIKGNALELRFSLYRVRALVYPIYIYIVVTTKEFSENKVLNNVELLQLKLHLLPHVVTLCFTYADDNDDLQTDLF